jgi:hypothetical protein
MDLKCSWCDADAPDDENYFAFWFIKFRLCSVCSEAWHMGAKYCVRGLKLLKKPERN